MSAPDLLKSIQFVVNQSGEPLAVQVSIADWEALLDWLEDAEDRELVKEFLPRLRAGPKAAGALPWEKAAAEWN